MINTNYIKKEINWQPKYNFDIAIHKTFYVDKGKYRLKGSKQERGSYQGGRLGSI